MEKRSSIQWKVVVLPPHFGLTDVREFNREIEKQMQAGHMYFILDAANLLTLDSFSIGTLLEKAQEVKQNNGLIKVRDLKGEPLNILQKVGLDTLLILEDAEENLSQNNMSFSFSVENSGILSLFKLSGMMYFPHDGKKFEDALTKAFLRTDRILLDLQYLKYLDSASLNILIQMQNKNRTHGKEIRFCNLNELMHDIFHRSGLMEFFRNYQALDDALDDWAQ